MGDRLDFFASDATKALVLQGVLPNEWSVVLGDLIACDAAALLERVLPICHLENLTFKGRVAKEAPNSVDALQALFSYLAKHPCKRLSFRGFFFNRREFEAIAAGLMHARVAQELHLFECLFIEGTPRWQAYSLMLACEKATFLGLKEAEAATFAKAFSSAQSQPGCRVRRLRVTSKQMPKQDVAEFANGLRSNLSLEKLKIGPADRDSLAFADASSVAQIYGALIDHPRLHTLVTSLHHDAGGAAALAKVLDQGRLRHLEMGRVSKDADLALLGCSMKHLHSLVLNLREPGDCDLVELWESLPAGCVLQELEANNFELNTAAVGALRALLLNATQLRVLRLRPARGLVDGGLGILVEAAAASNSLVELHIDARHLSEARMKTQMRGNSPRILKLERLYVSDNRLEDVLEIIRQHPSIVDLRLNECNLNDEALRSIADALAGPCRLRALALRGDVWTDKELDDFFQKLGANQGLESLYVSRGHVPSKTLLAFLDQHHQLQSLNYQDLVKAADTDAEAYSDACAQAERLLQRNRELARPQAMQQLRAGVQAFWEATTKRLDIADPFWDLLTMEVEGAPGQRVFSSTAFRRIAHALRLTKSDRSVWQVPRTPSHEEPERKRQRMEQP